MVGTKASLWACQSENLIIARVRGFPLLQIARACSGAHPALQFNGHQGTFLSLQWPEHEVNHSSPSTLKVKTEQSCTSAPLVWLHSVGTNYLVKGIA